MTLHGRGSVPSSTAVSVQVVSRRRSGASMSGEDDLELCANGCLVGSLIWRRHRLLRYRVHKLLVRSQMDGQRQAKTECLRRPIIGEGIKQKEVQNQKRQQKTHQEMR